MVIIKWFGHAAFLIKLKSINKNILIDPWITNPLSPIGLDKLEEPDYIIVTHDHGDHLGDTIEIMKKFKKTVFISLYEIAEYVGEQIRDMNRVIGANIGGPVKLSKDLDVIFTPAVHSSIRSSPAGVIVRSGESVIYHAGDTGVFYDMVLIRELYQPKIALLPIGGHFTMGIDEAVKAIELLKPSYVIPMHYNTFPVISADPEVFRKRVSEKFPETKVIILKPGEEIEIK
ncbi:MAG: metal-dependent hydrolase [Sulfolobales archaeon]